MNASVDDVPAKLRRLTMRSEAHDRECLRSRRGRRRVPVHEMESEKGTGSDGGGYCLGLLCQMIATCRHKEMSEKYLISEDEKGGNVRIDGREKWNVLVLLPFPSPAEFHRRYLLQMKIFRVLYQPFVDPETAMIMMSTAKCDGERKNDPRTPYLWLSAWELCQ